MLIIISLSYYIEMFTVKWRPLFFMHIHAQQLKLMIDAAYEIEEYVQRIEKKMRDLAHDD